MLDKRLTELQIIEPIDNMPTVEIDFDSLPKDTFGYDNLIAKSLLEFSNKVPETLTTVYVYECISINFDNRETYSTFFGITGSQTENLLEHLHHLFEQIPGVCVRYSDYLPLSIAIPRFHIEEKTIWRPVDLYYWYGIKDFNEPPTLDTPILCNKETKLHLDNKSNGTSFEEDGIPF